jgi:hypothetical protein
LSRRRPPRASALRGIAAATRVRAGSHPSGKEVSMKRILFAVSAWLVAISALHAWLNVNWSVLLNDRLPESQRKLNVAYIPVT